MYIYYHSVISVYKTIHIHRSYASEALHLIGTEVGIHYPIQNGYQLPYTKCDPEPIYTKPDTHGVPSDPP